MALIITYPAAFGSYVLASSRHPAVTVDAAWRPISEIESGKRFADEVEAKSYIARWFPEIPVANFALVEG